MLEKLQYDFQTGHKYICGEIRNNTSTKLHYKELLFFVTLFCIGDTKNHHLFTV